jgi:hypothetical protein
MTYQEACTLKKQLEIETDRASENLRAFDKFGKSSIGTTPDFVRDMPEWRMAKRQFDIAFKNQREFNQKFVKQFKKQISENRKNKYINKTRSNPMKKQIDMESAKVKKDLVEFFHKKFSDKTKKEIAEEIEESLNDNGRYSSYGTCYSVTVDGEEFNMIPSFDEFHQIAIDSVTQQLEDEPELFNQEWLKNHTYITDTDKRLIAGEEAEAYTSGLRDRDIAEEYERKFGELLYEVEPDEEEDEDGELDHDKMREALYDSHYDYVYEAIDDDAMNYFVNEIGVYTEEDYLKASFVRIDIESAAEDAVQEDGEAHFLSHYDGNYEETGLGIIVMKE